MERTLISRAGSILTFAHHDRNGLYGIETYQDAEPVIEMCNERKTFDPKGKMGITGEHGRLACRLPMGIVEKLAVENPGFMKWPAREKLKLIRRKMMDSSLDKFAFSIR